MARIHVICDASYDEKLKLTGFAGHVHLIQAGKPTSTHYFGGAMGELSDIHQGELYAVLSGLITLKNTLRNATVAVDKITVHTDSETVINQWSLAVHKGNRNPLYIPFIDRAMSIQQQNGWNVELEHVHGHIPVNLASPFERLHTLADRMAKQQRLSAMEHLIKPNHKLSDPGYCTIILPAQSKNHQEAEMWKALANHLASNQRKSRIYVTGQRAQNTHPFISSLLKHAEDSKISRHDLFQHYLYVPQNPVHGLDITLARHYLLTHGMDYKRPLKDDPSLAKAALASRLLYGDVDSSVFSHGEFPGRLQPASHVIYDLRSTYPPEIYSPQPNSIEDWVAEFSKTVGIPRLDNMELVLKHAGITEALLPLDRNQEYSAKSQACIEALKDIHLEYADLVEKNQWALMWVKAMGEHGYPHHPTFQNAMHRYIMINEHSDPVRLAQQTIRHAEKLSPPVTMDAAPKAHPTPHLQQENSFKINR